MYKRQRYNLHGGMEYHGITGSFPKMWNRTELVPIVKAGKVNSFEISKFGPFSLLTAEEKVLVKLLINRMMNPIFSETQLKTNMDSHYRKAKPTRYVAKGVRQKKD